MIKQKILTVLIALIGCFVAQAYTVAPACPDFMDITASYVEAFTGTTGNPFIAQGVVSDRHTLITTQGTDSNTGGGLSLLPPGESSVIRLGNQNVGAEAEALTYHFIVDKNNPVLLVKFAVVMEDPGHFSTSQPRFIIRITDKNGDLIEACAEYDVSARDDIPGFQSYQRNYYTPVRWRDWTNVGLDMSSYIGQEVQVQFITYDCTQYGHFGYAYFTASCIPNRLQLDGCTGSQFTLEAPDNFESYQWSTGETTRTAIFNTATSNNSHISCTVTSATGCQFPLYAYVTTNSGAIVSGSYQDVICEGETYDKYHFNLPAQEHGKYLYYNTFVNPATCSDNESVELELTVVQRYNYIKEAICHGQDYKANGFNIIKPAVGVRRDTLEKGTVSGCIYYDVLELTVSANLNMPNVIQGDASPCTEQLVTYDFAGAESLTKFEWQLPANAKLQKGSKFSQQITLYYTDDTAGTLTLSGENGCGSGTANLPVHPRQTYNKQLNEEICQGLNYTKNDFNLGRQDSVGYFVYEKHLKSVLGCDSTVTLALNVLPTPEPRIEPKITMLCTPGEEITLWALTDDMQYAAIPGGNNDAGCSNIPCGNYDDWYNTLTPADGSQFSLGVYPATPNEYSVGIYQGTETAVVIPHTVGSRTVTMIEGTVADSNVATEFVIPSSVRNIRANAFANNALLTCITIPASVTGIASGAFLNSPNIVIHCYENSVAHQYAIDNNITFKLIEDCKSSDIPCGDYDAWYNTLTPTSSGFNVSLWAEGLKIMSYVGSDKIVIIPRLYNAANKEIVSILDGAFEASDITEVVIPSTVTEIRDAAFFNCTNLTYVTIPKSVTSFGSLIFFNSPNVIIRCYENSTAHNYAVGGGIKFELIEECESTDNTTDIQIYDCELDYLWNTGATEGFITVNPTATTEYAVTVSTQNGCSAEAKQTVIVNTSSPQVIDAAICEGEEYQEYGLNVTTAGAYPVTLTENGCSLSLTVNLTVNPAYKKTIVDNICAGQPYRKNGLDFTLIQPGVFKDTLRYHSKMGCDSIIYLEITVLPEVHTLLRDTICQTQPYSKNGFNLPIQNVSGDFMHTLVKPSLSGCDEKVTLKLFVKPIYYNIISDEVPKDGAYDKYDFIFPKVTKDTTAMRNLVSSTGCDSMVVLNLTMQSSSCNSEQTNLTASICQNEPYIDSGFNLPIQTQSGKFIHSQKLISSKGCDSTVVLKLTVNKAHDKVLNLPLKPGGTIVIDGQTYTEPEILTKNYVNNSGCDSVVTYVITQGVDDIYDPYGHCPSILPDQWFSPNADTVHDLWLIENIDCYDYLIEIYDRYGKLLRQWENDFAGWDGMYNGNPVISDDYWYRIRLKGSTQKDHIGHFNLKR
jgi:gliding motility-associated-like protein